VSQTAAKVKLPPRRPGGEEGVEADRNGEGLECRPPAHPARWQPAEANQQGGKVHIKSPAFEWLLSFLFGAVFLSFRRRRPPMPYTASVLKIVVVEDH
jgi:hypothetical protein